MACNAPLTRIPIRLGGVVTDDASITGWDNAGRHTPENLRENLEASLTALKTDKVDMFYLYVSTICTMCSSTPSS